MHDDPSTFALYRQRRDPGHLGPVLMAIALCLAVTVLTIMLTGWRA